MHLFERAGLGKAPFQCVGYERKVYVACQGAPAQPGGTCDFCGAGIMDAFVIRSADAKRFVVGCDCVNKTGDSGLIKGYKSTPEYRKLQRERRQAKACAVHKELSELVNEKREALRALPSPNEYNSSLYGWAQWMLDHCGDSGRSQVLRSLKAILAGERVFDQDRGHYVAVV